MIFDAVELVVPVITPLALVIIGWSILGPLARGSISDEALMSNRWERKGPRATIRRIASVAAMALKVRISIQNCRRTCMCDAPMVLRVAISAVRSRTSMSTAKTMMAAAIKKE